MYKRILWNEYDYNELFKPKAIDKKYNPKTKKITKFSQFIIMIDTETCKSEPNKWHYDRDGSKKYESVDNFVCAFSISIRWRHENIVTLYGHNPHDCADCIQKIVNNVYGDRVFMFIFNMSYDWPFLKKFLINRFGDPVNQLNLESHQPISLEFGKLSLRDALCLAQRKLEKWAKDLGVTQKQTGKWDYSKTGRSQFDHFTDDELDYIECDTIAGVECIDAYLTALNIKLKDIPYTATGIARSGAYKIGRKHKAKELFKRLALKDLGDYDKMVLGFHGGYTHTNRHYANIATKKKGRTKGKCLDISSSYPTTACCEKFPMTPFIHLRGYFTLDDILSTRDKYAYFMRVTFIGVSLKSDDIAMPVMQWDKNISDISYKDIQIDNGRVLSAPVFEAYMTDVDLLMHSWQYNAQYIIISDVYRSEYGYLPRWFTDHVYDLYKQKCELKNGDKVLYDITKMRLNSVAYGMLAMRNVREMIKEEFDTGRYYVDESKSRTSLYEEYINNRRSIYPYQWSLWVTAWSQLHLHQLGACCNEWLYSDTDSCFSYEWDMKKVKEYNRTIENKLRANGYNPVTVNGKTFYLGSAEIDKEFDEFKALHSKCYAYVNDGELHTTIAGVPRGKGAECLKTLDRFDEGFVFDGEITGKLTHIFHNVPDIYQKDGNIYGDSIDLIPCDYKISRSRIDKIVDYDDDAIRDIVNQIYVKKVYSKVNVYE